MPRESKENLKKRVKQIIRLFQRYYKNPHCALIHDDPFQLLVATILSAQCTDERVNKVTPKVFEKYPDAVSMAEAKNSDLENLIRSTGFFKNKAQNIIKCSNLLVEKHSGRVPKTMEELVVLNGVGRKTANVILGNAYGEAALVVDTHVTRLSNRLGLVTSEDPEKIEFALNGLVEKEHWTNFSHWLIQHGREVCKARNPQCEVCFLDGLCPKKI